MLIDYLSINDPLDKPIILDLPVAYFNAISRNIVGFLKGRYVYYAPIPTVVKHICRIVVPTLLHHAIFNLTHAKPLAGHMGEYKTLYRIRLQFFWSRYALKFPIRLHNFFTMYSSIVTSEEGKN